MKKRSAMTVAAGLVGALLAGVVAMSLGFASGPVASAGSAGSADLKPRVRTIERTVTIHKKAKPKAPQVVTIAAPAAQSAPASSPAMSSSEDSRDDETVNDDQFEGEHESEGQDDGGWQGDEGEFGDD